jgi:hypothetical protein
MEKQQLETNVIKTLLSIFSEEVEYRLISTYSETQLDTKISEIESYMANNHGFGQTDVIKDGLYGNAKKLWGEYAEIFKDVPYTFYLNRKQYQFLTTLLNDKLEYDVNTVFLAIELTNMLGTWITSDKHKTDTDLKGFTADSTEITYMYHLIAKHKVKGLGKDTFLFAEVLRKIADISKIINYYDTAAKNMSTDIQQWVAGFEPQENAPSDVESEVVEAAKLEPKKAAKKAAKINE